MTTKIDVLRRLKKHTNFLKTLESHSSHAYDLITNKLIEEILRVLQSERIIKSDEIDMPYIPPPKIEINVLNTVQNTIDKYLQSLRYVLLGQEAGEEAMKIVEMMRIKTKIPQGGVIQSFLDSTDTHAEHLSEVGLKPTFDDKWRKHALEIIKERSGRSVDKSIVEIRNKLLNVVENSLNEIINTQHSTAKQAVIDKLKTEDLNSKERRILVKEAIAEAVKEKLPLHQARQILKDATQDYSTNWDKIVRTEIGLASNNASVQTILEATNKLLDSPVVAIVDKQDERETDFCRTHSHHDNGEWKYFNLSSLKPSGYNLGKKKSEWKQSVPLRHFGCRCILAYIPTGFKLDKIGSLIPLDKNEKITIEY